MCSFVFKQSMNLTVIELAHNEVLLTNIPRLSSEQEYGSLRTNKSVGKRPLTVAGNVYARGFGTHARSRLVFEIPENAVIFKSIVGLDDEAKAGKVNFQVFVDGHLEWTSQVLTWQNPKDVCNVDIRGEKMIELVVSPLGKNSHDHADWIHPVFIIE